MSLINNADIALFTVGNVGFAVAVLAIPTYNAVSSLGLFPQVDTKNPPANSIRDERVASVAISMGIVKEVPCLLLTEPEQTTAVAAYGSNASWSHPTLFLREPHPNFFLCARELVHIKNNHRLITNSLGTIAPIACLFSNLSPPVAVATLLTSALALYFVQGRLEKVADIGACSYCKPEEIAAIVHESRNLGHTARVHYLKEEYYKKPTQLFSIQVAGSEQTLTISPEISQIIREKIRQSKKELPLLGASKIVLHPERQLDNIEFCHAGPISSTYDVSRDTLQALLRANDEARAPLLLQLVDEALLNPTYKTLRFEMVTDYVSEREMIQITYHVESELPDYDPRNFRIVEHNGRLLTIKVFQKSPLG